jgi:hypothetical protein
LKRVALANRHSLQCVALRVHLAALRPRVRERRSECALESRQAVHDPELDRVHVQAATLETLKQLRPQRLLLAIAHLDRQHFHLLVVPANSDHAQKCQTLDDRPAAHGEVRAV